jgi:non-ribosomal peptide synthetase component F
VEVRREVLDAHAHQGLPFATLLAAPSPAPTAGSTTLVQAVFEPSPAATATRELVLPGLRLTLETPRDEPMLFDLKLAIGETAGGIEGTLAFARDLFDAATAERLAARLLVLLAEGVENPGVSIWELPVLSPAERHQVIVENHAADVPRRPPDESLDPGRQVPP